jgi:oligopeptide/dipeptide ABC transporter ATP-binding protein
MSNILNTNGNILVAKDLVKYFPINLSGIFKKKYIVVKAVDRINFSVKKGECFGLVGESGSGKSTTAYMLVGTYGPTSGSLIFKGEDISQAAVKRPMKFKKDIQIVFQDPGSSLNPNRSIQNILETPLQIHNMIKKGYSIENKVIELLDLVELPSHYRFKSPITIGGGERQLVAIARALATDPSFVVLDEPTSALDVSVQGKIINHLIRLQKDFDLTYLFITHDLSLMRNVATRIAIMYLGKIVEIASTTEFFQKPLHPYTKMLLSSIPIMFDEEKKFKPDKIQSVGEIPSPVNVPPGCNFNTRCPFKKDICLTEDPAMKEIEPGHYVRCHLFK